ncbi:MAG TPA: hypothetical protein VMV45_01760 [Casimicrobiaceae bacterium]|nr:hypothetical protein [Casimicrobiaceae bacterium]
MWQRIASPFKEFGAVAGTFYVIDWLLRKVSRTAGLYVYELMVQPIFNKALLPANLSRNLTFAEIGQGHPDIERMPARPDIKAQRFEQGAHCLAVYRKDALIGYMWFCYGSYREDEARCDYELAQPERSVFDFDLYVMPEHRMGIGFVAVWHGATRYLHERGIRYTFSRLTRFNVASRRSHAHLGWRRIAHAVFLRLGKVEAMFATLPPHFALTWSDRQRVRLRLSPDVLAEAADAAPSRFKPSTDSGGETFGHRTAGADRLHPR